MRLGIGLALMALCASLGARAAGPAPDRIGEEIVHSLETPHPYLAAPGKAGGIAWSNVIHQPGASYIAAHFSRFQLAPDDRLVVRSPDGAQSWSYTGLGRGQLGSTRGFWAVHIKGDTAVIELHARRGGAYGFTIDKFARGFRGDELRAGFAPESICGVDDSNWAKCYQASEPAIYDTSRAVARIMVRGTLGCTAWLIGSAGHLMTNNHCIVDEDDALNTDYEFMAEGGTCATSCGRFRGCPGIIEATTGTLVASDVNLDYALVLLPQNFTPSYGYLRLRETLPALHERIYVPGHPGGWGKRLAVGSSYPTNPSGYCEVDTLNGTPCVGGTAAEVGYACDTQGGSSGSPVIAYSDHKVVALHHCAGCPNTGASIPEIIARLGVNLPPGALFEPAGTVRLTRESFGCSGNLEIEVRDDSLLATISTSVRVYSGSEPGGEQVLLVARAADPGVFAGSIVARESSPPGDGELAVAHGDLVTVHYFDADDGIGGTDVLRTDTARVDCVPPAIRNVRVSNVTGDGADVLWDTDEPADSEVTYGGSRPPAVVAADPELTLQHSVHLTGLVPCLTHYLSVRSSDEAGNRTQDENDGSFYAFATGRNDAPTFAASGLPVAIPDNAPGGITASIVVSDARTVTDVDVRIRITHPFDADLDLMLEGPNHVRSVLSTDNGGAGRNYDGTVFDDEAGTSIFAGTAPFAGRFRPQSPLSVFDGISAAGTWTLRAVDDAGTDVGTLDAFELILTHPPAACGPVLERASHASFDRCVHGGSGNADGFIDPGESVSIVVSVANLGTATASNVTATLTSATAGVTVVDGTARYGNLAIDQSATGDRPFLILVARNFPCGAPIELELAFTSVDGAWSSPFTLATGGSPGSAASATFGALDRDTEGVTPLAAAVESAPNVRVRCNECAIGCPDTDDDGVCDLSDHCPLTPDPFQLDRDHDGLGDACDACPDSNLDPTVILPPGAGSASSSGSGAVRRASMPCDSGVSNSLLANGCTVADEIAGCDASTGSRRQLVACVTRLLGRLKQQGWIDTRERKPIERCAAQYDTPGGDDRR